MKVNANGWLWKFHSLTLQAWLLFFYTSLAFRENILRANGSDIRPWWVYHHYLAMAMALVSLTWGIQGHPDCARKQVPWNSIHFSLAGHFYITVDHQCQSSSFCHLLSLDWTLDYPFSNCILRMGIVVIDHLSVHSCAAWSGVVSWLGSNARCSYATAKSVSASTTIHKDCSWQGTSWLRLVLHVFVFGRCKQTSPCGLHFWWTTVFEVAV